MKRVKTTKTKVGKKQPIKSKTKIKLVDPKVLAERQKALKLAREARKLAWEHKRKLEEEERNKMNIIPSKDLTERQLDWINKNCQPKVYTIPIYINRRPLSRWAKTGPMTLKDWMRFYKWADRNAEAKKLPKLPPPPKKVPKKKRTSFEEISHEELLQDIDKLAMPKMPRQKYEPPPPIKYAYSPKIYWNKPPKHDKGRPFPTPKVPSDFQHTELEIDFWSNLRFPIRSSALKYTPSTNILDLAQPRLTPPLEPHCPIPEKPKEYIEPRRRMTRHQWREHRERLTYLARPVCRSIAKVYC